MRQLIQKRTDVKKFNDLPVRTENGNSYHNTSRTELRRRIFGFYYLLDPPEKLCSFPSLLPKKPEKEIVVHSTMLLKNAMDDKSVISDDVSL